MKTIIPQKLAAGSHVRIIAPSCSFTTISWMTEVMLTEAKQFFKARGMTVSEGKYIRESDTFGSTTIEHRLEDLHDAFGDPSVHALLCIRGGWNCNQLLPYLDYDLIKKNPKILCGFSDITALSNAIYAKTGVVTYSGPNFTQFYPRKEFQYTYDHFEKAVLSAEPIDITPSPIWTDAYFDPEKLWNFEKNEGWWMMNEGSAEGVSIGGNLCTLSLLQGTEYMPQEKKSILFIEDDHETHPRTFDRDLTSLTQQPWFTGVQGILFGRFQRQAVNQDFGPVTKEMLHAIVENNPRLKHLPIIGNVDFGHTYPIFTFPIGGRIKMEARKNAPTIQMMEH